MSILNFLNGLSVSTLRNFWQLDAHDDLPASPGAYILMARPKIRFVYPAGQSHVFYIGQAGSLRRRLLEHLKYSKQIRDDKRERGTPLYWPVYEYGGVFGGRYCFINTWRGMKPKALEDLIMARFAKCYHAFPVANGARAWARIEKEFGW